MELTATLLLKAISPSSLWLRCVVPTSSIRKCRWGCTFDPRVSHRPLALCTFGRARQFRVQQRRGQKCVRTISFGDSTLLYSVRTSCVVCWAPRDERLCGCRFFAQLEPRLKPTSEFLNQEASYVYRFFQGHPNSDI